MWRKLKNIVLSIRTYNILSPDLRARRQINRALRDRPSLSLDEWYETFWRSQGISSEIAAFVYIHLAQHSGLEFARVWPGDRLEDDLKMTLVCWFDWQLILIEEFKQCFGVDLSDDCGSDDCGLDTLDTIEDFVRFLDHSRLAVNSSSSA